MVHNEIKRCAQKRLRVKVVVVVDGLVYSIRLKNRAASSDETLRVDPRGVPLAQ